MRSPQSFLELKLATPPNHGDTVQFPDMEQIETAWRTESHLPAVEINGRSIGQLRAEARRELLAAAFQFSRQYGDFSEPDYSIPITMAGHQPDLFHAGVWYKNFVLSNVANRFHSNAVNVIIDNDTCTHPAIRIPHQTGHRFSTQFVPFDSPSSFVPFEERKIIDPGLFQSFGKRAAAAIRPVVKNPIIHRLWELTLGSLDQSNQNNLGRTLAQGRHQLERESGLNTLEVPLGDIADSRPFVDFSFHMLNRLDSFQEIYNRSVELYRKTFKVRSHSHPVPNLAKDDEFLEAPFWIWHHSLPQRKRLFVRDRDGSLTLTDRDGWTCSISNDPLDYGQIAELRERGVKIRPRALITTMYCRLILSRLFIHGIGGAKYDRLTDYICEQFFGILPPPFLAVSATMKLRSNNPKKTHHEISVLQSTIREMVFHPERFIAHKDLDSAKPWVDRKMQVISAAEGSRFNKDQFEEVDTYNQKLGSFVLTQQQQAKQVLSDKRQEIENDSALCSREASFCIFPETLIDELTRLANIFAK